MNRRNFLKRLAAVAAGAVAMPTLAKSTYIMGVDVAKGRSATAIIWDEFGDVPKGSCNTVSGGVTQEQLADLIKCTVRDLPQDSILDFRTGIDNIRELKKHYSILDIYRSKNANNSKNFMCHTT